MSVQAFGPITAATKKLSCTTTSGAVQLTAGLEALSLRISVVNGATSAAVVHVKFGSTSPTATTSDFPIPVGQSITVSRAIGDVYIAGRTDTGTADLYVTPGDGQ